MGARMSAEAALSNALWYVRRQGRVLSSDDATYIAELRQEVKFEQVTEGVSDGE